MDRLTGIAVLASVVEEGGFSAAARKLGMSVTMASNHVRALEERLGARLLNRTTRKVSLTDIGRVYHERATAILNDLEEADRVATASHATPRGPLKLHASIALARFLTPVLAEYLERYPAVSATMTVGDQMVDMVGSGYDLVVRTMPAPESTVIVRKLTAYYHVPCCAPSYLHTHPAPQTIADLAQHNCVRFAYYPFGDEWRFKGPDGKVAGVRIHGNLVTESGEAVVLMVSGGHAIAMAPSFMVARELASGEIVRLLPAYRGVDLAINAIYPSRSHLAAKVRCLIDLLGERFAAHRKWMAP